MMTRKEYADIAAAIRDAIEDGFITIAAAEAMVDVIVPPLARANDRFDSDRFVDAALGTDEERDARAGYPASH